MPYVIAEPCGGVKDKSCVTVCPVDCIQEGTVEVDGIVYDQLFINPNDCIDCNQCVAECPVDAIFLSEDLPSNWKQFAEINAEFYKSGRQEN
jgi:ferredoxin